MPFNYHSPNSSLPSIPRKPLIWFVSLWICLLLTFHINGMIEYMDFSVWLLSLSMFSKFIHVVAWLRTSFLCFIFASLYSVTIHPHLQASKSHFKIPTLSFTSHILSVIHSSWWDHGSSFVNLSSLLLPHLISSVRHLSPGAHNSGHVIPLIKILWGQQMPQSLKITIGMSEVCRGLWPWGTRISVAPWCIRAVYGNCMGSDINVRLCWLGRDAKFCWREGGRNLGVLLACNGTCFSSQGRSLVRGDVPRGHRVCEG